MVYIGGTAGPVDWNQMVVHTQAVALGIAIGEQPALQHPVRREAYAGNYIGRIECRLLYLGKEVLGIAVELHYPHLDKRIVSMVPDFGQVEGVIGNGLCLLLGHYLDEQLPARIVSLLNAIE